MDIWRFFGNKKSLPEQEGMESETSSPPVPDNTSISSGLWKIELWSCSLGV